MTQEQDTVCMQPTREMITGRRQQLSGISMSVRLRYTTMVTQVRPVMATGDSRSRLGEHDSDLPGDHDLDSRPDNRVRLSSRERREPA